MNPKSKNKFSVQWDISCSTIFDCFSLLLLLLQSSQYQYLEASRYRKAQVGVFSTLPPSVLKRYPASIANIIFAMIFLQWYFCSDISAMIFLQWYWTASLSDQWKTLKMNEFNSFFKLHKIANFYYMRPNTGVFLKNV